MADTDPALFRRFSDERVRTAMRDTPVVMINGPRQSGKTTLVREFVASDRAYVTLNDETLNNNWPKSNKRVPLCPYAALGQLAVSGRPCLVARLISDVRQKPGIVHCIVSHQNFTGGNKFSLIDYVQAGLVAIALSRT